MAEKAFRKILVALIFLSLRGKGCCFPGGGSLRLLSRLALFNRFLR
ncbi:MAG: hypothetical protein WDO70_08700 [Alphaproteobacteria bacterium]